MKEFPMAEKIRVRVFVDFWNFQLNWNDYHSKNGATAPIPIPWKELPAVLVAEAVKGQLAKFAGIHVYASVNSNSEKDRRLSSWLHHSMAGLTGYIVDVRERKPRKTFRCQEEDCKTPITTCPACKKPLRGTVEKGIDAAIITDLITLASDDNYDLAVLISGDADYAPAVQFIQRKTDKQVVQAFFRAHGDQLRNVCWDHIFFEDLMSKLLLVPTGKENPTA
jgi:uncharacterized LabA/DUF88 family protein